MTYTPLITAAFFDGPRADMLVTAGGYMSLAIIIIGVGLIVRVMSR